MLRTYADVRQQSQIATCLHWLYGLIHSRAKKIPTSLSCPCYRRRGADGSGIDGRQVGGAFLWWFALCLDRSARHYSSRSDARLLYRRTSRDETVVRNQAVRHSRRLGIASSGITTDGF